MYEPVLANEEESENECASLMGPYMQHLESMLLKSINCEEEVIFFSGLVPSVDLLT